MNNIVLCFCCSVRSDRALESALNYFFPSSSDGVGLEALCEVGMRNTEYAERKSDEDEPRHDFAAWHRITDVV